jgi:3-isopropylmalate/(R)-2-methylmalate dehydratase small subunit
MNGEFLALSGRVAAKLGDNVDTDVIYPARYLNLTDREKTADHLFGLAYPDLRGSLRRGDFIVAGKNFGCGSSREQASAAIKYAQVGAVIAISFARIFYRNSVNLGLPVVVSREAPLNIDVGDELEVDLANGLIVNKTLGATFRSAPLDPRAIELLRAGGLIPYLKAALPRRDRQGAEFCAAK